MKKFMLSVALLAVAATPAIAQEEFAPKAGDFSTELQFNPFSNDFGTFKLDQLKFRYMLTDNDALRLGIGFGVDNAKVTPDPDNEADNWGKISTGSFSINIGYERHFFNYKRLDIYAGAALGYEYKSANGKLQVVGDDNKTYEYQVCNAAAVDAEDVDGSVERASNTFNFNLFTGVDFYVYKGLYVGAELGIRLAATSMPGYYTKGGYNDDGVYDADVKSDPVNKVSGFSLECYAEPSLRIGYTF